MQFNSKEKYLLTNTLNCLPQILQGKSVLLDLHNEISVAGRIDHADGHMNISLVDAVLIDRNGLQYPYDNITVRDRKIRQMHIPDHIDIKKELDDWIENGYLKYRRREPRPMKSTFKRKRAEMRHKETLQKMMEDREETGKE